MHGLSSGDKDIIGIDYDPKLNRMFLVINVRLSIPLTPNDANIIGDKLLKIAGRIMSRKAEQAKPPKLYQGVADYVEQKKQEDT